MKKSTLILLLVFVVSGLGTLWYLNQPEEQKTTILEPEADFAIKDIDKIGKIFLASRIRGNQITFERKDDDTWTVNDTFPAHPKVVRSLLQAIKGMRIKFRPSAAATKNIVKRLAADQVKTEIYDRDGNLMKTYYVGGETPDARGTYMIMEGSEKPFVMELKSMTGSFRVRYDLSILDARDKGLFRNETENINYVSIDYPTQRNQSFILDDRGSEPKVTPVYETSPIINKSVSKGSVERYYQGFKDIIAEALVRNVGGDDFEQQIPFAKMKVGYKDGTERTFDFYPRETLDPFTKQPVKTVEKFATIVDGDKELIHVTQLAMLSKLFGSYENFF